LIGIFFVNSLGMFIGNITKSSTEFEIVYIIFWYVAIFNGSTSLDFLGLTKKNSCKSTYSNYIFCSRNSFTNSFNYN